MNFKTLLTGAVVGMFVFSGAYFFLPPPQTVQASCSSSTIQSAINYCMDGARISNGRISTYC